MDLGKQFTKAARSALVAWKGNYGDEDDLVHDLWIWYLESPAVQKKLEGADAALSQTLIRKKAMNILKKLAVDSDLFDGRTVYSSDAVREALRGESSNNYLSDILPMAMTSLEKKNPRQAEAVKSRYLDGVVPPQDSSEKKLLARAVKSLTERVNIIAITAGITRDENGNVLDREGPGSRSAVFPQTRKAKGDGHSDPTADVALALINGGDDPITLCAMTSDRKPVRGPDGRWLDSDVTTTLRKEFVS